MSLPILQVTLRALILPNLDTPDLTVGDQINIAVNVLQSQGKLPAANARSGSAILYFVGKASRSA